MEMKRIVEFYRIVCKALWAAQLTRNGHWQKASRLMQRP
jgi:hypothetical protein